VLAQSDSCVLARRTQNLSYDGLLVDLDGERGPRLGERVRLRLRIPESDLWIEADGIITRLVGGRRTDDEGPAAGIHVLRMHGMDRILLMTVARGFPAPAATRGPRRSYANAILRIAAQ
jgi:hypothetical protein